MPEYATEDCTRFNISMGIFSGILKPQIPLWNTGDVCALIAIEEHIEDVVLLLFRNSTSFTSTQKIELIVIPQRNSEGEAVSLIFEHSLRYIVVDINESTTSQISPWHQSKPLVPSYGILQDGKKYFVDHILLYSDGFSQFRCKKGSSGGAYCLSLNYPPELKRSRERVRVLTVTPPGISSREGLRSVIPDLVHASTRGNYVTAADGERVLW